LFACFGKLNFGSNYSNVFSANGKQEFLFSEKDLLVREFEVVIAKIREVQKAFKRFCLSFANLGKLGMVLRMFLMGFDVNLHQTSNVLEKLNEA
jgi:hypothetical protein